MGVGFQFANIKEFVLRDVTIKDPITFGVQLGYVEDFTLENINFDYNDGNPAPVNMDGIHLEGGCKNGYIHNLKAACFDDMVALNADEMCMGEIKHIKIEGLYAEDSHSAVRMLSAGSKISNINISDVFGSFYQYGIGFTKYYNMGNGVNGLFEHISIKDSSMQKTPQLSKYCKDGTPVYPLIWFQKETLVKDVIINNIYRNEKNNPVEMIRIDENAEIQGLFLDKIFQESQLNQPLVEIVNNGRLLKSKNLA